MLVIADETASQPRFLLVTLPSQERADRIFAPVDRSFEIAVKKDDETLSTDEIIALIWLLDGLEDNPDFVPDAGNSGKDNLECLARLYKDENYWNSLFYRVKVREVFGNLNEEFSKIGSVSVKYYSDAM